MTHHSNELLLYIFSRYTISTEAKCRWVSNIFNTWREHRNSSSSGDNKMRLIENDLEKMTKEELNYSISHFIIEVKKKTGEEFPPKTLYEMVFSLQKYLAIYGRKYKLLDDPKFSPIRKALDREMKKRAQPGDLSGGQRKATVITVVEEHMLWARGFLGEDSPEKLLNTIIYLFGTNFAMYGAKKHRSIRRNNSQITLHMDARGVRFLRYCEDIPVSDQGEIKTKPKVIDAYENRGNPARCIVRLYQKYLASCPKENPHDAFYLRPMAKPKDSVWYSTVPVGINKLSNMVKVMCKEAGLEGFRSNHSLRACAAINMCKDAGMEGYHSNHPRTASTAANMYQDARLENYHANHFPGASMEGYHPNHTLGASTTANMYQEARLEGYHSNHPMSASAPTNMYSNAHVSDPVCHVTVQNPSEEVEEYQITCNEIKEEPADDTDVDVKPIRYYATSESSKEATTGEPTMTDSTSAGPPVPIKLERVFE